MPLKGRGPGQFLGSGRLLERRSTSRIRRVGISPSPANQSGGPLIRIEIVSQAYSSARPAVRLRAAPLWLALIALALFLPGFVGMQPIDRDEPRFAQATKQMLETGDFVSIRFQDQARNKKPVGIYWAQAAVVSAAEAVGLPNARRTIWLYRIPSLLGALATVLLTYWAGLALGSRRMAFMAGVLVASTIVLGVEARLAKTDAVDAATVVAALGVLARLWMRREQPPTGREGVGLAAIFWIALAAGILVKGPVAPMVIGITALTLSLTARSGRWLLPLRPLWGVLGVLLLVSPWFVLIVLRTRGAFLTDSVGADMLAKVGGGMEGHGAPPGTHLLAMLGTAWPLSPFLLLSIPFLWANRREPAILFLLAWAVPNWLVFEAVPTKLPHYVLPMFPALALLAARAGDQGAWHLHSLRRRGVDALLPLLGAAIFAAAAVVCTWTGTAPGWPFFVGLAFFALLVVPVGRPASRPPEMRVARAAAMAFLVYIAAFSGLLAGPFAKTYGISPQLEAAVQRGEAASGCTELRTASAGYAEPSLIFLDRTDLHLTDGAGAARFLADGTCRAAMVESRFEDAFRNTIGESPDIVLVDRVRGFNFNKNAPMDFGVYLRGKGT